MLTDIHFNPNAIWDNADRLVGGAVATLGFSTVAISAGLIIGFFLAILRNSHRRFLRSMVGFFVLIFSASPFLVVLYILFYALPFVQVRLDTWVAGIIGLSLYSAAYLTEILRASFESVPPGQVLAAQSLGFSRRQVYGRVIVPQGLSNSIPQLGNQFIDTVLASSILVVIGSGELTFVANTLVSETYRPFEIYAAVGVMYYFLTLIIGVAFQVIARSIGSSRGRRTSMARFRIASGARGTRT